MENPVENIQSHFTGQIKAEFCNVLIPALPNVGPHPELVQCLGSLDATRNLSILGKANEMFHAFVPALIFLQIEDIPAFYFILTLENTHVGQGGRWATF